MSVGTVVLTSKCTKDDAIVKLLKGTKVDTLVDAVVSDAVWNPDWDGISFVTLHWRQNFTCLQQQHSLRKLSQHTYHIRVIVKACLATYWQPHISMWLSICRQPWLHDCCLMNIEWPAGQCHACWVVVHILPATEIHLFSKSFPEYFLDFNWPS